MKPSLYLSLAAVLFLGCEGSGQSAGQAAGERATNVPPSAVSPATSLAAAETSPTNRLPVASANPVPGPQPGVASPAPAASPDAKVSVPPLPGPVADLVRMAQTRLSEEVLVRYVEGIREPVALDADQLIYLADLGIPDAVILALQKKGPVAGEVATSIPPAPPTPPTTPVTPVAAAAPASAAVPAAGNASPPYPGSNVGAPVPAPVYGPAQPGPEAAAAAPPPPPAGAAPAPVAAPSTQVTYNIFYDSLAPYGTWVDVGGYGWCWRPTVAVIDVGWRPYCHGGRWLWSDYGWYWHSTYSWGWAPFHYGRWHHAPRVGWVWAPGCDWGPAWVAWRWNGSHCGWAPLPPAAAWSASLGFTWSNGGTAVSVGFGIGSGWWSVSPWTAFCGPSLPRHCLAPGAVGHFVDNTRIQTGSGESINIQGNNNTVVVNKVVDRDFVQPRVRDEIRKVHIGDAPTVAQSTTRLEAGGGSTRRPEIAAFRPRIQPAAANGAPPSPPPSALARQETRKPAAGPGVADSNLVPRRPGLSGPTLRPEVARPANPPSAAAGTPGIAAGGVPVASRPVSAPGARPLPSGIPATRADIPSRPAPAPSVPGAIPGRTITSPGSIPSSSPAVRPGTPAVAAPARPASPDIPRSTPPSGLVPSRPELHANPAVPGAGTPAPRSSPTPPSRNPAVNPSPVPSANPPPARPTFPAPAGGTSSASREGYRPPASPVPAVSANPGSPAYPGAAAPSAPLRPGSTMPAPTPRPSYPSATRYPSPSMPSGPSMNAPAARPYAPSYSAPSYSAPPSYPAIRSVPPPSAAPAPAPGYRSGPSGPAIGSRANSYPSSGGSPGGGAPLPRRSVD